MCILQLHNVRFQAPRCRDLSWKGILVRRMLLAKRDVSRSQATALIKHTLVMFSPRELNFFV